MNAERHLNALILKAQTPHPELERLSPLSPLLWRALPLRQATAALQELVRQIERWHTRGVHLGGLRRDHVRWDAHAQRLILANTPQARALRDEPEELWRDVRLIGELLFECALKRPCPNGHELAALLQYPTRMVEAGLSQPGLPQILAGCVTPYGELAYTSCQELWQGLELLRVELTAPLAFTLGARSTVGVHLSRRNNQDACGIARVSGVLGSRHVEGIWCCVADGIGGIEDGERASSLAVSASQEAFMRAWSRLGPEAIALTPVDVARGVVKVVSQRLAIEGELSPDRNRGGTTFSAVLLAGARLGVAHVGDSRITLLRQQRVIPMTTDHNLAVIFEELGELTEEGPRSRAASERTISRFLSTGFELELDRIDSFSLALASALQQEDLTLLSEGLALLPGDRLVLTTDGAHGELSAEALQELSAAHPGAQGLCDAIVARALMRSSRDNVTALVVDAAPL